MSSESLERIARNKNVARAAARQLSMEQLHKLAEVIGEVIEQKQDEDKQRQQEEAMKERKLAEIREAIWIAEHAFALMLALLKDLPLLGFLFRRSEQTTNKTNLYFFVTPTILDEDDFQDLMHASLLRKLEEVHKEAQQIRFLTKRG